MSENSELVKRLNRKGYIGAEAAQAIERLERALEKINGIRNSVIGAQSMNFSEHVYPLVAALEEAGYEGLSYAENRENLGTLIERAEKAEQQLAEARAQLKTARAFHQEVLGTLADMGICTPQEGYLKPSSPRVSRDLRQIQRDVLESEALTTPATKPDNSYPDSLTEDDLLKEANRIFLWLASDDYDWGPEVKDMISRWRGRYLQAPMGELQQLAEARAEIERKDKALDTAAAQFRVYEGLHAAKGSISGDAKARTNAQMAGMCEEALAQESKEPAAWPNATREPSL